MNRISYDEFVAKMKSSEKEFTRFKFITALTTISNSTNSSYVIICFFF